MASSTQHNRRIFNIRDSGTLTPYNARENSVWSTQDDSAPPPRDFGDEGEVKKAKGIVGRLKKLVSSAKLDRKRMAALGLGCLLSYGFVSNINVGIITAVAWATFSKQSGLSPLAPGQWGKFVAVQVGIYAVFGNLLRPLRIALSVSIAPMFDKIITFLQKRLKVPKGAAVFISVILFNFIINISFMMSGIWVASRIVGVPAIPPGHRLDFFGAHRIAA